MKKDIIIWKDGTCTFFDKNIKKVVTKKSGTLLLKSCGTCFEDNKPKSNYCFNCGTKFNITQ